MGVYAISWLRASGAVVRARKVIADALEQAERVKKDAEVAAKEEYIKRHEALESRETRSARNCARRKSA